MAKNYLIGIGGTGARVAEAAVHMCAAGYGPEELTIFLVDPDVANGNLTRTKTMISLYQECRKDFKRDPTVKFFKTDIKTPDPLVWKVFMGYDTTLADHIAFETMKSANKDLADFVTVLFSDDELSTSLNKGFRGHPSIGAVLMADPPTDEDPWKMFCKDIDAVNKQYGMRVFLVGSVFGGTGAAGVPTIGSEKLIKNKLINHNKDANIEDKKSKLQNKILLGGALILPYFSFDTEGSKNEKEMFVTPNDFPIATKAALHYYSDNEQDLGFDQLYFIGDSLRQNVGKFSAGSTLQANRPHYIEIITALAANDFFKQPEFDPDNPPTKKYYIACRDDEIVRWNSLPFSRGDTEEIKSGNDKFKSVFITMVVFSYAMCTYGKQILDYDKKHNKIYDTWYRDSGFQKNRISADNERMVNNFCNFSEQFLAWICAIDEERVKLIDRDRIINGEINIGESFKAMINYPEEHNENYIIGRILKEELKEKTQPFSGFITELNKVKIDIKDYNPASRFINIFCKGASEFSGNNYTIKKLS